MVDWKEHGDYVIMGIERRSRRLGKKENEWKWSKNASLTLWIQARAY
jgi:hypothetical protein